MKQQKLWYWRYRKMKLFVNIVSTFWFSMTGSTWRSSTRQSAQEQPLGNSIATPLNTHLGQSEVVVPLYLHSTQSYVKYFHIILENIDVLLDCGFLLTDIHGRGHSELYHQDKMVQWILWQITKLIGEFYYTDTDDRENHVANTDDCDDHQWLQGRFSQPCSSCILAESLSIYLCSFYDALPLDRFPPRMRVMQGIVPFLYQRSSEKQEQWLAY